MAISTKALQRKREKKKKKRQAKKSNFVSSSSTISYSNWPVYECWEPTELWEMGLGQIIVTRRSSLGEIAVGIYLIDVFCLGVKNCYLRHAYLDDYKNVLGRVRESCGELKLIEPSHATTLILKVVEYAKQLGFKPHHDFAKAKQILKNIPVDENLKFDFGKDGKPCYMQGPNESPADVRRILKTLELNRGTENYHFMVEAENLR